MLALDLLRVLLPHVVLLGIDMPLVGAPSVCVKRRDAKRLQEFLQEGVSHVLDLSEGSSKLIPINEEPNHQIVHLFRLGKAQRPTH